MGFCPLDPELKRILVEIESLFPVFGDTYPVFIQLRKITDGFGIIIHRQSIDLCEGFREVSLEDFTFEELSGKHKLRVDRLCGCSREQKARSFTELALLFEPVDTLDRLLDILFGITLETYFVEEPLLLFGVSDVAIISGYWLSIFLIF